jgi:hypothetical protein
MANMNVDLDSAYRMMKHTLEAYHDALNRHGDGAAETERDRNQFVGAKFFAESSFGSAAKDQLLRRLRADGFRIPHSGPRTPDGAYLGHDSDADI